MAPKDHGERMATWRARNDNGDCGRVANELLEYIEPVLVPVGKATEADPKSGQHVVTGRAPDAVPRAYLDAEPPRPINCIRCGGDGSQGRPFCSSPWCEHRVKVKVEQLRQGASKLPPTAWLQAMSLDELYRMVATYCPSLVGFLPPEAETSADPNPNAAPRVYVDASSPSNGTGQIRYVPTAAETKVDRDYVAEQITGVDPKLNRGKLPSERIEEVAHELAKGNGDWNPPGSGDRWNGLIKMLDERLGRG